MSGSLTGTAAVYGVELRKLVAQPRIRVTAAVCLLGPLAFSVALAAQEALPRDSPFGRYAHESGAAVSLVVLGFAGQWLLPVLIGLVAGETLSGEQAGGTWSTLVTRGVSRTQLVLGKAAAAATWSALVVLLLAVSATAGGLLTAGWHDLVTLTGVTVPPGRALGVVAVAWLSSLLPALGWTGVALLASSLSRRAGAGVLATVVVGAVVQLATLVPTAPGLQRVLLSAPTAAWHGLASRPAYTGPLLSGALVSAVWALICVAGAVAVVRSRDQA